MLLSGHVFLVSPMQTVYTINVQWCFFIQILSYSFDRYMRYSYHNYFHVQFIYKYEYYIKLFYCLYFIVGIIRIRLR